MILVELSRNYIVYDSVAWMVALILRIWTWARPLIWWLRRLIIIRLIRMTLIRAITILPLSVSWRKSLPQDIITHKVLYMILSWLILMISTKHLSKTCIFWVNFHWFYLFFKRWNPFLNLWQFGFNSSSFLH